ncbi:MAG: hypothetical protein QME51_01970 [Planctomycetota bacterium]|nr:hypothetical protein [Planctomycetota bacterium]MDI6787119.1 hypothetical protein [Planctomycetota bacterium]
MTATLKDIASQVNMPLELVRDILTEKTGIKITKEEMDLVFKTARGLGYDFRKLKIGKRINLRKEILSDIIKQIESNPKWKRNNIVDYLKRCCEMIERVDKKAFEEEFKE